MRSSKGEWSGVLIGLLAVFLARADEPLATPRLVIQLGESGKANAVISGDGRIVVSVGDGLTPIVWDGATGKELRRLVGHTTSAPALAIDRDGRRVYTVGDSGEVFVWDTATGKPLRQLRASPTVNRNTCACALSPDEKWLATWHDREIQLWDLSTGKNIRSFRKSRLGVPVTATRLAFSPDGKHLISCSHLGPVHLWDVATGQLLVGLFDPTSMFGVGFATDGKSFFVTGSRSLPALKSSTPREGAGDVHQFGLDGKRIRKLSSTENYFPTDLIVSPDGRHVLTSGEDGYVRIWDLESGKMRKLVRAAHRNPIRTIRLTADGKSVLAAGDGGEVRSSRIDSGDLVQSFTGWTSRFDQLALSPDGRWLALHEASNRAMIWDLARGHPAGTALTDVTSVSFSRDGEFLLTGQVDGEAQLRDVGTWTIRRRYQGSKRRQPIRAVFAGPQEQTILLLPQPFATSIRKTTIGHGPRDGTGKTRTLIGDVRHATERSKERNPIPGTIVTPGVPRLLALDDPRGKPELLFWSLNDIPGPTGFVHLAAAISPDGRTLYTDCPRGKVFTRALSPDVVAWDLHAKKELGRFSEHTAPVTCLDLSTDTKRLLSGSADGTARLWDVATRRSLRVLNDGGRLQAVSLSRDGKRCVTLSAEGWVRLWDLDTGQLLVSVTNFRDGGWAVIDPRGRFDASHGGDVEGLHWVVGNEPVALEQLKERYYEPGLLAKHLGFSKEKVREVSAFAAPRLYPRVEVEQPDPKRPRFVITLVDRGGGIGAVAVRLNGKEVLADARPRGTNPEAKVVKCEVDLSGDDRLARGLANQVEVIAANAEGYLRSRGMVRRFIGAGKPIGEKPRLWGLVVGVSRHRNRALDLRFASKDAEDFARALTLAAGRLLGDDHVRIRLLASSNREAAEQPTRGNLLKALQALEKAKPGDLLVVYLAGHGIDQGGSDGDFHYLTGDATTSDLGDPEVRRQTTVSSRELTDLLKRVPAAKQVLILDTCAAGRLIDRLTEKREVPSSQVRALERVKDRTGMHVLAGCTADAVSYEANRYAQGLLTYSLLLGMRGAALADDQVDVVKLFGFASEQVPALARNIGGIQRPVFASPRSSQSFPIGRLTVDDRGKIPLARAHPLVGRSNLQEEVAFDDVLGLARRLDERVRGLAEIRGRIPLVFVDASDHPEAYRLVGRYRIVGDRVTVTANLFLGGKLADRVSVTGSKEKPDDLAGQLAQEVRKRVEGR